MAKGVKGFSKGYIPWNKGKVLSLSHRNKIKEEHLANSKSMSKYGLLGAKNRWRGHIKVKKITSPKWRRTSDPVLQLQKKRFRNQRYKARKTEAEGSHTFMEWLELKHKYMNMCLCCKEMEPNIKLTEDHIIPLSMGGSDNIENIQPLCMVCNTRKNARAISYLPTRVNSSYFALPS
jgi:5-methylcytosine-specific restriction endonuclease McrA